MEGKMSNHQLSDDEVDMDDYEGGELGLDGDHGYREVEIREQDRYVGGLTI